MVPFFLSKIPSISTKELQKQLDKQPLIIDVREPSEYVKGHIPQAKNIPLQKLVNYQSKLSATIYVVCQSGMRSKQGAKILQKKGYPAINVKGGMNRWDGPMRVGK